MREKKVSKKMNKIPNKTNGNLNNLRAFDKLIQHTITKIVMICIIFANNWKPMFIYENYIIVSGLVEIGDVWLKTVFPNLIQPGAVLWITLNWHTNTKFTHQHSTNTHTRTHTDTRIYKICIRFDFFWYTSTSGPEMILELIFFFSDYYFSVTLMCNEHAWDEYGN